MKLQRRNKQRGQVSIMIALIFQVVFIFFAMVINIGLVINDKINLQNSVDIAAYYGAMKQAEILNAMAHVNYQIRQIYKLMNWRLWALSDAGRNTQIFPYFANGSSTPREQAASWNDNYNYPVVCIYNQFWYDTRNVSSKYVNACSNSKLSIPNLKPVTLGTTQTLALYAFLQGFEQQSRDNANAFAKELDGAGSTNFLMAYKIMLSYKFALLKRRIAMQRLENLLVQTFSGHARDFSDLSGNSVGDIVQRTLMKNLTVANRDPAPELDFQNSLNIGGNQPRPFLVPIEVRVFLQYLDFDTKGANLTSAPKDFPDLPHNPTPEALSIVPIADALTAPDRNLAFAASAGSFFNQSENAMQTDYKSLVGFEKNPWILAYVYLKATTHPKMLFSPTGTGGRITLTAEAYAMPFGSRIGPWYYNNWLPGAEQSSGDLKNRVDNLLPPRLGDLNFGNSLLREPPNYSRFPGDNLGMSSERARTLGLAAAFTSNVDELPHFAEDDYKNLVDDPSALGQDPLVYRDKTNGPSIIRSAEISGIAPDLFDAVYYSVDPTFMGSNANKYTGVLFSGVQNYFFGQVCPTCKDLGALKTGPSTYGDFSVANQIRIASDETKGQAYWLLDKPEYLSTSWTQESTDPDAQGQRPPQQIGLAVSAGGRIGYSVKLVSKKFLTSPVQLGGPTSPAAVIQNPPTW
jgi:hypothetical protein